MGWSGWEEFGNLTTNDYTYERRNRTKATAKQALPLAKEQTQTPVETVPSTGKVSSAPNAQSGPAQHQVIKLGVDVHLDRYVVVCQVDGGAPQPPQRFSPASFWSGPRTDGAGQGGLQLLRGGPLWLRFASEAEGL
jgi:hypothetical protein